MEHVTLCADFAARREYRLLAVDAAWVQRQRERIAGGCEEHQPQQQEGKGEAKKRGEEATLLIMKGREQLLLCDEEHTFRVRRVEYSNTLLLAEERAMCDHEDTSVATASESAAGTACDGKVKQKHVVICAAERLFEAKRATPQQDAVRLLLQRPMTIDELEADDEEDDDKRLCKDAGAEAESSALGGNDQRDYTFPQLVALCRCSAHELATTLAEAGAVVHRGHVRLLHPSLLREALQAVLFFFEGGGDTTWEAAEAHLCPSVYPPVVVHAVRAAYGKTERAPDETAAAALLQTRKVVQALAAVVVLAGADEADNDAMGAAAMLPSLELERFYDAWADHIPASFFACGALPPRSEKAALLSLLNGAVIIRRTRGDSDAGAVVVWAPHEALPAELPQRVERLFELNPGRWDADALRAYVQPLLDPGVAFDHVVHRHAKEFRTPNQPVTYGRLV
ncbi:sister chromatid cohesion protein DCC1 [Trypanosoma grayi]|uniref:sister chromatid cohesion protein DCC1 n=1 Tax=Trypanosoma grayi TaxID=71804 RepID=UPI0004F49041|nr:sister chromatid cohesion protein DCC1 [Trypanosoma grayi]KEG07852.1 sister chromatid cohesion protein DCC1 [Trypanosoma grayi]